MVVETETAAAQLREELGTQLVGMEKIRHQNPLDRPTRSKSTPKPPCHAASKNMRERFRQTYRAFVAMFQEASLKLKFGNVTAAIFPQGQLSSESTIRPNRRGIRPAGGCWRVFDVAERRPRAGSVDAKVTA